eukprot:7623968-Ditylum_brightwellii.AAC.1
METTFYDHHPPALRLQHGPNTQKVSTNCDLNYGHQDGELNCWMPWADPPWTEINLWTESFPGRGNHRPLGARRIF